MKAAGAFDGLPRCRGIGFYRRKGHWDFGASGSPSGDGKSQASGLRPLSGLKRLKFREPGRGKWLLAGKPGLMFGERGFHISKIILQIRLLLVPNQP
jgi:hypothetical protein